MDTGGRDGERENMSDKKKNLINGIFLLTVFVLTIYSVFSGEDLSDIVDTISEASPVYLLMGVGCVIFSYGRSLLSCIICWAPRYQDKEKDLAVFLCGVFSSRHHAFGRGRTAGPGLLYEEEHDPRACGHRCSWW